MRSTIRSGPGLLRGGEITSPFLNLILLPLEAGLSSVSLEDWLAITQLAIILAGLGAHAVDVPVGYTVDSSVLGGHGILAQRGARIADNIVVSSGGDGISASAGSVRNNVVRDAGVDGVGCFSACVIEGNSAHESGRDGVACRSSSCVMVESVALTNGRDGILAGSPAPLDEATRPS